MECLDALQTIRRTHDKKDQRLSNSRNQFFFRSVRHRKPLFGHAGYAVPASGLISPAACPLS